MEKLTGRSLLSALLAAGAALFLYAAPPKSYYELDSRCQEFTRALADGNSWQIYRMFVPQFQAEVSFRRFDSAFTSWYDGRRIARVKSLVVDIKGLGGHASTWPVFEGETDYSYVYQNWFYAREGWHLIWLSNILNQSFQYGQNDTAAIESVAAAALAYITSPDGLAEVRPGLRLPDTVVVIWQRKKSEPFQVPNHPVVALMPKQVRDRNVMPLVPFYFSLAAIRMLGDFATCAIDVTPTPLGRAGILRRQRGVQLCFEHRNGSWQFNSLGKKW